MSDGYDQTDNPRPLVSLRDWSSPEAVGPARSIVVLGMHRSGTSAVAQLLGSNGADLGDPQRLVPANEHNPRGHFESLEISEFNEYALSVMAAPWWAPPTIEVVQAGAEDLVPGARQAWRGLGSASFRGVPIVKDPRFSLLLPIWRPVFGPDTLYVVCVRNPLGVARSLLARDRIDLSAGIGLWEAYNIACLHGLTGCRALFVDVDHLMAAGSAREDLVRRVRSAVGLVSQPQIEDTFEPSLIAGECTPAELFEHLSGSQLALHQSLANLPAEPVVVDDLRHLRLSAATLRLLSRNRKLAVDAEALQAERAAAQERVAEVSSQVAAALLDIDALGVERDQARGELADARGRLDALLRERSEMRAEHELTRAQLAALVTELRGGLEEGIEDRRALTASVESAASSLQAMQYEAETAQRDVETARRDAETAQRDAETARRDAETAQRDAETARCDSETARRRAAQAQQELAEARDLVKRLIDQREEVRAQACEAGARADRAAAELAATHHLYGQAFASRSWRWTKPLRRERRDSSPRPTAEALKLEVAVAPQEERYVAPQPMAPIEVVVPDFTTNSRTRRAPRVAVVVHVFYPDLWESLTEQLGNLKEDYDLFISLTEGHSDHLESAVRERFPSADVQVLENRGRDIAPFLGFVRAGKLDNYAAVLKLHTKRSHHRVDGDEWRVALWHGLLPNPADAKQFADLVSSNSDVGCIVPAGNVMTSEFLGSNSRRIAELLARVGLDFRAEDVEFPAGSMYWLDGDIVQLLKALSIDPVADFELEDGQIDGTTAHALERLLGVLLKRRGQAVVHAEDVRSLQVIPDWATRRRPKVLAFYLPQFHRIAENDAWWGEGFTEWTNVESATAWYGGQRLPRIPARALGRYALTSAEIPRLQAELARAYGVDGFLVYHYWFSGRRLLEGPMNLLLDNPDVEFPHALVWANENWTRSWDGLDGEVLVRQKYEPGWESGLFASLLPHLHDKRYVHVDGHPLVVLFKPALIPHLDNSVAELRRLANEHGVGPIHLAGILHDRHVPVTRGAVALLDSWIEFPPLSGPAPVEVTELLVDEACPRGQIYSYPAMVDADHWQPLVHGRRVHPGVMPSWDNTPRRTDHASSFAGSNPADFRRWLINVRKRLASTSAPGEMLVCINAWNEWAETAYLEPDQAIGVANLEAVRSAFGHLPDAAT